MPIRKTRVCIQYKLLMFSVQINTFSMDIQIDLGTLRVIKHITLEMENCNSFCVYLLLRRVVQYIIDREIKP